MKKSTSIVLFGTYAEENCGDDLLLVSQIITLREPLTFSFFAKNFTLMSQKPPQ